MKVTFLGTGTSTGIPVLTCKCEVCKSLDYRDNRLRVSILIQHQGKNIIIDTGPDFRQQALNVGIETLDAVVFTHEHKDHTGGLDDVRPFNYLNGRKTCNIYAYPRVIQQLKNEYYYVFQQNPYPGVPKLNCFEIDDEPFDLLGLKFVPISVMHHNLQVYGFRIQDFTYITDANFIAEDQLQKINGTKVLVLNALQHEPHISHYTLSQAVELSQSIGADQTYFTHISHKLGLHAHVEETLPDNIFLAYDGLVLEL